jgi:hypothetical protein
MKCNKQLFIEIDNSQGFYSFQKLGCYEPTPLK